MTETKKEEGIHELAGGWIAERTGTQVPGFLKLSYVGFCIFGLVYLVRYWAGETAHATRGPLVQQANAVMQTPGGLFLGALGLILVAYAAILLYYAFFGQEHAE